MVEDRDRDGKMNEFVFGVGTRSGIMPTQTDNYATSKLYFKCKGIENFPISCVQRTIINPCQITLILHNSQRPFSKLHRNVAPGPNRKQSTGSKVSHQWASDEEEDYFASPTTTPKVGGRPKRHHKVRARGRLSPRHAFPSRGTNFELLARGCLQHPKRSLSSSGISADDLVL